MFFHLLNFPYVISFGGHLQLQDAKICGTVTITIQMHLQQLVLHSKLKKKRSNYQFGKFSFESKIIYSQLHYTHLILLSHQTISSNINYCAFEETITITGFTLIYLIINLAFKLFK